MAALRASAAIRPITPSARPEPFMCISGRVRLKPDLTAAVGSAFRRTFRFSDDIFRSSQVFNRQPERAKQGDLIRRQASSSLCGDQFAELADLLRARDESVRERAKVIACLGAQRFAA